MMSIFQDDTVLTKGKDKNVKLFYIQRVNLLIIAETFVPPVKLIKKADIFVLYSRRPPAACPYKANPGLARETLSRRRDRGGK